MSRISNLILLLCMLCFPQTLVYGAEEYNEARGQLLYTTHCNACHSSQIHWREQKLVTDWQSLVAQVNRWQFISGLNWSEDEVKDVSHHLDALFYGYKNTVQGKKPVQLMHKN